MSLLKKNSTKSFSMEYGVRNVYHKISFRQKLGHFKTYINDHFQKRNEVYEEMKNRNYSGLSLTGFLHMLYLQNVKWI